MSKSLLIFDGDHLLYRAYYKFAGLKTLDKIPTAILYGFPYIMKGLLHKFQPTSVCVAFGGGRSKYRMEIHPDYKKRDHKLGFDKEDFDRQKFLVMKMMKAVSVKVAYKHGEEADDLITMMVIDAKAKFDEIIIISGDKDFNQLIDEQVSIWHTQEQVRYTHKNFKGRKGYSPEQVVDYLCLDGDSTDNIPGYKGFGEKGIKKFFQEFSSIDEYLQSEKVIKNLDKKKLEKVYAINRQLIDLNLYYITYLKDLPIPWINQCRYKPHRLMKYCRKFEIRTFADPAFLVEFEKLRKYE